MSAIYLAVVKAYNLLAGAEETLYFSSGTGFVSAPTDTPADTFFDPKMKQPLNIGRNMFGRDRTRGRSAVSLGDLILNNEDGAYDYLAGYAFDGRTVTVYRGAPDGAFPSGFTELWEGTMEGGDPRGDEFVIRLRDVQEFFDAVLIQDDHYDGDNSPPAGLEGGADLEGAPKPIAFGVCRNISAPLVNSSKLIYQAHDGALDSVDMVYDNGIEIIPSGKFTSRTNPSAEQADTVVWCEPDGQFVTVPSGSGGFASTDVLTSPDGITWTVRTIQAGNWQDVKWGNGVYVAIGGGSASTTVISTSPDGITWTARTPNIASAQGRTVATDGEGNWIAVASNGDASYSTDDGATWTATTTNPTAGAGITARAGVFAFGRFFVVNQTGAVIESTDGGDTWTTVFTASAALRGSALGGGRLVIVGDSGLVVTSTDGETWTERDGVPFASQMDNVAYGPGYFMCGSDLDDVFATSVDGINWDPVEIPWAPTAAALWGLAWGQGALKWVATAATGTNIWSSSGAGATYGSLADLQDDALAPDPGEFRAYPAGGYFRLGSPPAGVVTADVTEGDTAADRTAAQLMVRAFGLAGWSNMTNLVTEDDLTAWATSGTPGVTSGIDDPVGGTDAFTVTDNDGAAQEYPYEDITFTGDGVKVFEFVVRERTPASSGVAHVELWDNTASAVRARVEITWTLGVPTFTAATGTLVDARLTDAGYWRVRALSTSVTAANTNRARIMAAQTASATGALDVFRVRAYDETTVSESWDWMDVERLDNATSAVLGLWTGVNQYLKASDVISRLADSVGAWWGPDRFGVLRLARLEDPQVATNMLGTSRMVAEPRDLSTAAGWTHVQVTVTADDEIAPDGTTTMDKIVEDTSAGSHYIQEPFSSTHPFTDDEDIEVGFFARADERSNIAIGVQGQDSQTRTIAIDLSDGTVSDTDGPSGYRIPTAKIQDMGDGVYKVRASISVGAGTSQVVVRLSLMDGDSWAVNGSYTGDGSSGLHVWDVKVPQNVRLTVTEDSIIGELRRLGSITPAWRHHFRYRVNHTVQDVGGLAFGVSEQRREVVARPRQETQSETAAVKTRHLLAVEREVDSHIDVRSDATTEASRLQSLRGVPRERYGFEMALDDETSPMDIGQYLCIEHPRYRLQAGKEFVVMRVQPNAAANSVSFEVWG